MNRIRPQKRHLENVVRDLFGPLLGPRPGSKWKIAGWDCEQGLSLTFEDGKVTILVELEERNVDRDCYSRTKRFNIVARRPFAAGLELSTEERAMVDAVVNLIRQREDRLPVLDRQASSRRLAVREIEVDRVLIPEGRGHYYLNPYVGCTIGCPYCYVGERADFSRSLEGLPRVEWGRYVDVKINAADVLRHEVERFQPGIVRMSPILTDPYQPIERKYRITRQCLEVLSAAGFDVALLTRAGLVVEDIELLKSFKKSLVGLSIPTDQDKYRLIFEPGADPIDERLEALETLSRAGLFTVAFIQPILPMDPLELVKRVSPFIRAVRIDRMYAMQSVKHLYEENRLEAASVDDFFEEKEKLLRDAFGQCGVPVDDMDDIASLLKADGCSGQSPGSAGKKPAPYGRQ